MPSKVSAGFVIIDSAAIHKPGTAEADGVNTAALTVLADQITAALAAQTWNAGVEALLATIATNCDNAVTAIEAL